MSQVVWQARLQPADSVDGDLFDVAPLTETVNRFANSATLLFDDPTGDKIDTFPRGQRIELEYSTDGGSTFTRRFAGSVQDTTETTDGGADRVEVELVGYDHWLRVQRVEEDFSSTTLSSILQTVIEDYTPVNYVGGNVTVTNDQTVTWNTTGDKADTVINRVASASGDEDYGVNDAFEFFFAQRETERAGSDIVDGDWLDYRLPEKGSNAVNRVDLFYGASGSRARVTVEDRAAQRDLKTKLNAPSNVVIAEKQTFDKIDNEAEAETKAREILNRRSPILTGTVTTFDRFDMEAGEVFRLEISEKNIDADFRIAQIEYHWSRDETVVTVAEQRGDVEDLLVELADDVKKIDLRDADFDATASRFLDLRAGVTATPSFGFSSSSIDSDAFVAGFSGSYSGFGAPEQAGFKVTSTSTSGVVRRQTYKEDVLLGGLGGANTTQAGFAQEQAGFARFQTPPSDSTINTSALTTGFLNQIRDTVQGESANTITHVGVGSGTTDAVSTDSTLDSEVGRVDGVEQGQRSDTEIELTGRIRPTGTISSASIAEAGLFDAASGGTMYLSLQFDAITPGRRDVVDLRTIIGIDNDPDRFGVVTSTGQQRVVDLFLGDTGHEPTDMAFGTGTADASEGDTALGNKVIEKSVSFADRSRGVTDIQATLGTGDANGNTLAELGLENSANELLARAVFEGIDKTSNFELSGNLITSARNA